MKKLLLILLLLACCEAAQARSSLPDGYRAYPESDQPIAALQQDFDNDGVMDLFAVVTKTGQETPQLMALLKDGKTVVTGKNFALCCNGLSAKGNTVIVQSNGMRGFSFYKFRWDEKAKDFRLIGYDTESAGNAVNDGSGVTSLNLLTGDFHAALHHYDEKKDQLIPWPVIDKKIAITRSLYLTQLDDEADDWLSGFSYGSLPKDMQ